MKRLSVLLLMPISIWLALPGQRSRGAVGMRRLANRQAGRRRYVDRNTVLAAVIGLIGIGGILAIVGTLMWYRRRS